MKPLKVVFIWHQHQPYYKIDNEFILPWVRLHGIKDYLDLNELLNEYPQICQTVNLVPSLNIQLEDYINNSTKDKIQKLTEIPAAQLSNDDKSQILDLFFICNLDNLIKPYKRFFHLYNSSRNKDYAINNFNEQDWRDLQVWYNLCWSGYFSSKNTFLKRLIDKGRNFTETEKMVMLDVQHDILRNIIPQIKRFNKLGQLEISVSAFYHPILPLLIDNKSALEAMPEAEMPKPDFAYPEDARIQISEAVDYYKKTFDKMPTGFWPPEGSLSDETLKMIIDAGFSWTATDEKILKNSIGEKFIPTEKFFPRKYINNGKEIAILFRDHFLSDRIGFVYSSWNPQDSANDFCHHLRNIRGEIIRVHGESALDNAAVSVILDGENCWEFYKDNGIPFLRLLYEQISNSNDLITVTADEATAPKNMQFLSPINSIKAGSWINANFSIWIGDRDDRKAWSMLSTVRRLFEEKQNTLSEKDRHLAMEHIKIAEGSDWFWWYGPEHNAPNKGDFDILFRKHLTKIYKILGIEPPVELGIIIDSELKSKYAQNQLTPELTGKLSSDAFATGGYINPNQEFSTMHATSAIFKGIFYANDNDNLYLRIEADNISSTEIKIEFMDSFALNINNNHLEILNLDNRKIDLIYIIDEVIELSIPLNCFDSKILKLSFSASTSFSEFRYPETDYEEIMIF